MDSNQEGPVAYCRLIENDGTKNPFDPESFEFTMEQQEVIQTNARAISLLYCAEWCRI